MWQDIIISGVCFAFGFMLIPQVRDSFRGTSFVNVYTSFFTIIGLALLAIAFASLGMWLATVSEIIAVFMWIALFSFSLKGRKKNERSIVS